MVSSLRHKKLITWTVLGIVIQIVERDAPRVLNTNNEGYYVPDVTGNLPGNIPSWGKVEDVLLENLNEDIRVPLCKVSKVTINSNSSEITAYATLKYEVILGITKSITVVKSIPVPHYKNPTGDAVVN